MRKRTKKWMVGLTLAAVGAFLLQQSISCIGSTRAPCIVCVQGTSLSPKEETLLKQHRPVGVMLMPPNCESEEQVKELTKQIHHSKCLVAADIERLINKLRRFYSLNENPADLRNTSPSEVYAHHFKIASYVKSLGIDIIFCPLTDVSCEGSCMTEHAFSDDPEHAALCATAAVKAYQDSGVAPVIKHLPGHGKAADFHDKLPIIDCAKEVLEACNLKTSQRVIEILRAENRRLPAAMTAHVKYLALDPEAPATFSATIFDMLRKHIGLGDSVVFSDSLNVRAVQDFCKGKNTNLHPFLVAYKKFQQAGGDIAVFGATTHEGGMVQICGTIEELAHIPRLFTNKNSKIFLRLKAMGIIIPKG
ncbi:MAG: hypothetical protein LBD15_04385 [Holosporales bacterium]|jgi:beta-N-acetylhexosaminidase|nr:hypothetical protein [Holosporales bacterium]